MRDEIRRIQREHDIASLLITARPGTRRCRSLTAVVVMRDGRIVQD
jgi:hypothetical protein